MAGGELVKPGEYLHEGESPYSVFGVAIFTEVLPSGAILIGRALNVTGYETTYKVNEEPIDFYHLHEQLLYLKAGEFESPESVVVYMQEEPGVYQPGQFWWREIQNFGLSKILCC